MPNLNPLHYLGVGMRGLGRRMLPPGDLSMASDIGGYTGQGPLYGSDYHSGQQLPPVASPVASGSMSSGLPARVGQQVEGGSQLPPRPSSAVSYGGMQDPVQQTIDAGMQGPPPLPRQKGGMRGFLGTLASIHPLTAAFAPRISYGQEGLDQLRQREDWESAMPSRLKAADLYVDREQNQELARQREEAAKLRQQQYDLNAANIETDNLRQAQQLAQRPEDELFFNRTLGSTAPISQPSALPPQVRPMSTPSSTEDFMGPQILPPQISGPSSEEVMAGMNLPKQYGLFGRLSAQSQIPEGSMQVPSGPLDPQGSVRSRRQPAPPNRITPELAKEFPELGLAPGQIVDSKAYSEVLDLYKAKMANPALHFDASDDDVSGDRTITAMNSRTGEVVGTTILKGVARKRPPASANVSVNLNDDAVTQNAVRYNQTGELPSLGMGASGAEARARIINRAAELGGDIAGNRAGYAANKGALTSMERLNAQVSSFEATARKNLDLALQQSALVDRTGSPMLNRISQAVKTNVWGDPELQAFHTAVLTAANEYAKVVTGQTGGAAVSDAARREVQTLLDTAQNPKQFKAAVDVMKQEMANRVGSLEEELKRLQGNLRSPTMGTQPTGGAQPTYRFNPATGKIEAINAQ